MTSVVPTIFLPIRRAICLLINRLGLTQTLVLGLRWNQYSEVTLTHLSIDFANWLDGSFLPSAGLFPSWQFLGPPFRHSVRRRERVGGMLEWWIQEQQNVDGPMV